MARSYRKRKAYRAKKAPTKKRAATKSSLATQVVSAIGGYALKRLKQKLGLNTEVKYKDTTTNNVTFSTTLTSNQNNSNMATLIAQGLTDGTRIGDSFRMTRYVIRGSILAGGTANVDNTVCRIIVVDWGKTPYASASTADILEVTTAIYSQYTDSPADAHTVLYDKIIPLGPYNVSGSRTIIPWEFDYRPLSHHVRYTAADTTGALNDVVEGFIACYIMCSTATVSNFPVLQTYTRVEWVDN